MKLVMLLAVSNASRASDLASLDLSFQQFTKTLSTPDFLLEAS